MPRRIFKYYFKICRCKRGILLKSKYNSETFSYNYQERSGTARYNPTVFELIVIKYEIKKSPICTPFWHEVPKIA